ncbi:hypothetical protein A3A71_04310 [Candidatus Berkelbacteria bacterium RIFCSPLOWO2_01_FULL_50_28]|uniref:DUF3592 domain-containing protein n=1 Tax=Candidatus Berkelbacteria bacterium RIFCSPLOWO2_01_FULL_50_28 TaxID=1797471 RepID=A0A1F5EAF2_9BACT|nr:MAG: hypothetical protein A2807_03300 [Candidatus Berkelbacteria bacterium RIFCSPHIGHO2_01_FULL_50_36]OGD62425.1 MAG: hypothetical protein A3F39_01835 [Candidatus Berkelbacteria bacterium RIFCSPHIGHO2_12_FULL_50_11]OGD64355.1 MAG: hypothetical protein A3A71_04310 [Candidatus Berkelbacteria bacterium RIFCSPLOWO2_01_FULL_50_28]
MESFNVLAKEGEDIAFEQYQSAIAALTQSNPEFKISPDEMAVNPALEKGRVTVSKAEQLVGGITYLPAQSDQHASVMCFSEIRSGLEGRISRQSYDYALWLAKSISGQIAGSEIIDLKTEEGLSDQAVTGDTVEEGASETASVVKPASLKSKIVISVIGFILIGLGAFWFNSSVRFSKNALSAPATVVSVASSHRDDSNGNKIYIFTPTVKFTDNNQVEVTATPTFNSGSSSSSISPYSQGDTLTIYYDPSNPKKISLNKTTSLYVGPLVLIFFGVLFFIALFANLIKARKKIDQKPTY